MKIIRIFSAASVALAVLLAAPVLAQTASDAELAITAIEVKKQISDKTLRSYSRENGQIVEYFAPNGTLYLWPGRSDLMVGKWKTCTKSATVISNKGQKKLDLASICRTLPKPGGGEQAFNSVWPSFSKGELLETASGDIFSLAKLKTAPYKMPKSKSSFEKMQNALAKQ